MSVILLKVAPPDVKRIEKDPELRLCPDVIRRATYQTALERANGNICLAAELLGIDRRTLQRGVHWHWHPSGTRMDGRRHEVRRVYGEAKATKKLYELGR